MRNKIYIVGKKMDDGLCMVPTQAFTTFEGARKHLFEHVPFRRRLEVTDRRNEFRVTDNNGKYIQTVIIRDLWVNE